MDEKTTPAGGPAVPDLAAQLLAYAEALEATRSAGPGSLPDPVALPAPNSRRRPGGGPGRWRAVSVAAAVILLGGAVWWWADSDDAPVSATEPATGTDQATTVPVGGEPFLLLPDLARWAVADHYEQTLDGEGERGGTWIWRLDGRLVLLLEDVVVEEEAPSRDQAAASSDGERASLRWDEDGTGYSLQGLGLDEDRLRDTLASLTRTDEGWELPGADLVVGEGPGPRATGVSRQITLSPRDEDGVPVLGRRVDLSVRPGSPGDLYREVHEASGMGPVSEVTIAGQPGVLIEGEGMSYAIVAADGWVVTVTSGDTGVDLEELLETLRPVSGDAWDDAIAGIETNRAEAVAAADLGPIELPDGVLPRYRLPEPWTFERVTDTGIWTPEERSQRQALNEAMMEEQGGSGELLLVQGYRVAPLDPDVPTLADVVVRIHLADHEIDPADLTLSGDGTEPYTLGTLEGIVWSQEYILGTYGAGMQLVDGRIVIEISSAGLTPDELRAFVDGLTLRGDDATTGFLNGDSGLGVFEMSGPDLPGDTLDGGRWHAAMTSGSGADAVISVERLDLAGLQMRLSVDYGGADLSTIEDGRYLAATWEPGERISVLRYDETTGLLVELSADGTIDDVVDLFDELVEVGLEEWRVLVEPFNAKPLEPR